MSNHIISYGEIVSGINLNADDSMMILNGGIAINTTVNERGRLTICSGGMARDTKVFSNGEMSVSSGGKAVNTILSNVDFLFARGVPHVAQTEQRTASSVLAPASGIADCVTKNESSSPAAAYIEVKSTETDLSQYHSTSPREIYSLVNKIYPGLSLADQLHLVALIYAINSDGGSIASRELVASLGYDGSPGQFSYCGRVVKTFDKLGYHIYIAKNSDRILEEFRNVGIDGFAYLNPVPIRIFNYLIRKEAQLAYSSLTAQDISHLVSFLYTVATNESMPQKEYMKFEHGPSEGQYKYYHRSIRPLNCLGYHIVVGKD